MVQLHQQVGSESKHCEEGPILFFFRGAQESLRKLPPGMDMCWVPPSRRCCAESVRACLHGSTFWQSRKYFLVWGLYEKNFLETCRMSFSLAHYLCVPVSIHVVYIRVYIHIVLKMCSGSSHASHLNKIIKFDWTIFFCWSSLELLCVSESSSCQPQLL